jgi:hypothetical protein
MGSVANLVAGGATLYSGTVGAAEPLDTQVNSTPAASAWTDAGFTDGGLTATWEQSFYAFTVDQVLDTPERRIISRNLALGTNLAEPTLENLALGLNGTVAASGGSGATAFKSIEPITDATTQFVPAYKALIMDAFAPSIAGTAKRRRVFGRRCMNPNPVGSTWRKDGQTMVPVTFATHYVSDAVKPWKVVDQNG